MNTLYLIDGFGGSPKENWLETEGQKLQAYFIVKKVRMTDPSQADVRIWDQDLESGIQKSENAYFICHSLGCISLLRYLSRHSSHPKGCVFVSGFNQPIPGFPEFNPFSEEVDLSILSNKLPHSIVLSARNDSIVPSAFSQTLARKLDVPFLELPEGNHFRASDGILSLPVVSNFIRTYWVK